MNNNSPYYYLSKYRSELMGLSILLVVWFHSSIDYASAAIPRVWNLLLWLKNTGYAGVDFFFMLSGMGLFRSLQKNPVPVYAKNRLKRILPTWWVYLVIFYICAGIYLEEPCTLKEMFGFATCTGWWFGVKNAGNWFIHAIMFLYLVSPFFTLYITQSESKVRACLTLIAVSFVLSLGAAGHLKMSLFARLPLFLVGMSFPACLGELEMNRRRWAVCGLTCLAGIALLVYSFLHLGAYLVKYGLSWYPFLLIAPCLLLMIGKLFDLSQNACRPLLRLLAKLGKASFEILMITDLFYSVIVNAEVWNLFPNWLSTRALALSGLLLGCLFHILIEAGRRLFEDGTARLRAKSRSGCPEG